jgi:molybdate transport system substrate-binding protein
MILTRTIAISAALATATAVAGAAEISLIAPGGIRAPLDKLVPAFEQATGNKVTMTFASGGGTTARVVRGDAFDVPIVQPPLDSVIASAHVVAASATPLASVAVGVAVRPGEPKPGIATADAVKRLLFGVASLSSPSAANGAAAAVSFDATLSQLGIADAVKPKIKVALNGNAAMTMLANGEVALGVTFVSEMYATPGIAIVGALPKDISKRTDLVAFVGAAARDPAAARALVAWLSAPAAAATYRALGLEPAGK